jgi:hypothetical protein
MLGGTPSSPGRGSVTVLTSANNHVASNGTRWLHEGADGHATPSLFPQDPRFWLRNTVLGHASSNRRAVRFRVAILAKGFNPRAASLMIGHKSVHEGAIRKGDSGG